MKKLILTAILFGFGAGFAQAEGGGGSNDYVRETMQQVRSNDYSTQFDGNGHGTLRGSLER